MCCEFVYFEFCLWVCLQIVYEYRILYMTSYCFRIDDIWICDNSFLLTKGLVWVFILIICSFTIESPQCRVVKSLSFVNLGFRNMQWNATKKIYCPHGLLLKDNSELTLFWVNWFLRKTAKWYYIERCE